MLFSSQYLSGPVYSFVRCKACYDEALSQPLIQQGTYLRTIHFSFTTLTTLGYGDIVPLSEVAQVLTNLEAIVGQAPQMATL